MTREGNGRDWQKTRNLALFTLSVSGYLVLLYIVYWGFSVGRYDIPGGDAAVWDRAGDQVRTGISPYQTVADNSSTSFWYGPPFAVAFAAVSWLPPGFLWAGIVVLELAALRYLAGSWRNVGITGWFPLTAFELVSGNFNFVIAAGILAAVRGRPEVSTVMSFAKLSPVLSAHPRDWRPIVISGAVVFALSLPALWLWPAWITALTGAYGQPLGLQIPVPFAVRAVIAGTLLLLWRPWSRALAAVIAIPAFYWASLVMLLAPIAVRARRN
jgi:hypothetical protein